MALHSPDRLTLVAGPCMLESERLALEVADALKSFSEDEPRLQVFFKGSFDKANRTSLRSPRGPGLPKGLQILAAVKERTGLPVVTDIHLPEQAAPVAEVVDVLQIPAFLCRQTDLLVAAAKTGRVVKVKKGQFLSPMEMRYAVEKLQQSDAAEIWLTERGTTFGYQNLVVDMRSIPQMSSLGCPVIFDATHSVQMPGAGEGTTSGKREFVPCLARAALAAGANGLFIETHPNPDHALSDGPNQVPLFEIGNLLAQWVDIWSILQR